MKLRAGALLGALLMILMTGPGMVMTAAAAPRGLVFSTETTSGCDPATNPDCVCTGRTCVIVVPINPPGDGGGSGDPRPPVEPGDPGGPGDGGGGSVPPPPEVLPPPEEIWDACASGVAPPPGFVCPDDGEPLPDPAEPLPPPPTEAEVLQLVSELQLPEPQVGSAPCSGPGCMGAVGMPVWLWTQPWQSVTDTATIRIYELTLTATPVRIDWSMGDGSVVSCTSAGTPYLTSYGITESPTCGYTYERTSANQPGQAYTLEATLTYQVTWSGVVSGSTQHTLSDSAPVRIGEYQTVITHNG